MLTKTKIALAATLVLGTATASFAEDSSSSFGTNVYPQATQQQTWTGRNVALTGRGVTQPNAQFPSEIDVDRADRASSPYAGGGF